MTANNIKHHVQTVHEGLGKFKCDKCIKFFTNKQALNKHIEAIHEGYRNYYKCEQCDKSFSQQSTFTFIMFMKDSEISNVIYVVNHLEKAVIEITH